MAGAPSGGPSAEGNGRWKPAPPRPGAYDYVTSGWMQGGSGTKQIPETDSHMTLSAPDGTDQEQSRQSPAGSEVELLRYLPTGIYMVRQTASSPSGAQQTFSPATPLLVDATPAAPGTGWSWRTVLSDGHTTEQGVFKVTRSESVTVGGASVPTMVIEGTTTISGSSGSVVKTTAWFAPSLDLTVKDVSTGTQTYGDKHLTYQITETLRSLLPS